MEILELIKQYTLNYLTFKELSNCLSDLTKESEVDINNILNTLLSNGDLFMDEKGKITISADKGFFKAKLILNKKGYGFAQVDGKPDFFIPAFAINGAFDGDDCLVEITSMKSEQDIEAKIVKVLRRNTTKLVGTYIVGKSKNVVFPDDEKYPQIRIMKQDAGKAKNNDKVWVELEQDSLETKILRGKIVEVLGKANTIQAEQLSIIRSHNLIEEFDNKTLAEAAVISQNVELKNFKNRKDYTEHKVITIDGEDARDFDDALSIEDTVGGGHILYVHIADVSNYVEEGSSLDKEAYARGTSVYFPNQVIPMLPKELSNGICSLNEGVNRLTLSVAIELDKFGKVLSSNIYESVIKSSHRMTYTEIKNILEGDSLLVEKYSDVYKDILAYQQLSKQLKEQRRLRGELRLNLPEPYIIENEEGEIVSIEKRVQDESHEIIESLMILANECVAKTFFDLKIPFVYRVHEKPDEEKALKLSNLLKNMGFANELDKENVLPMDYQILLDKLIDSPKEETLTKLILRSLMKAKYYPTCLGHFGLASEFYCHFTSPIRRYPDLMIHRIIKQYLHGSTVDELKSKFTDLVEKASVRSSETERNADETEREVDDYKKALYMKQFLGQEFEGTISGVQEFGVFVELDNGIEGLVRVTSLPEDVYEYDDLNLSLNGQYNHFTIGDKVKIIVANANERSRQVDFDMAGVERSLGAFVKENFEKEAKNKEKQSKKGKFSSKSKSSAKNYYKHQTQNGRKRKKR